MMKELLDQGYIYHDLPQMPPEYFDKFIEIVGEDNIKWLTLAQRTWSDKSITKRGQLMLSPEGQTRAGEYVESIVNGTKTS